jgi:hypothetical protein
MKNRLLTFISLIHVPGPPSSRVLAGHTPTAKSYESVRFVLRIGKPVSAANGIAGLADVLCCRPRVASSNWPAMSPEGGATHCPGPGTIKRNMTLGNRPSVDRDCAVNSPLSLVTSESLSLRTDRFGPRDSSVGTQARSREAARKRVGTLTATIACYLLRNCKSARLIPKVLTTDESQRRLAERDLRPPPSAEGP